MRGTPEWGAQRIRNVRFHPTRLFVLDDQGERVDAEPVTSHAMAEDRARHLAAAAKAGTFVPDLG